MTWLENRKFPAKSLLIPCLEGGICNFWAEFEDFGAG
jgi:hypothetical protein